MSYLENGSTLRSMFRLMLPLRHDIDPTRSEVITHIKDNLRCDIGRAIRAFNSMRHKKSQVLVYDMVHRQWRGCDWVPPEEGDKVALLTRAINEMKRELFALKSEVRKQGKLLGQLERKRSRKREMEEEEPESEAEVQEEKSSPDVNSEELKRLELENEKDENFRKLQEATKDPAFWDNIPSYHSVPSVEPLSSPSGSTAPTRFRWVSAEGLVPLP